MIARGVMCEREKRTVQEGNGITSGSVGHCTHTLTRARAHTGQTLINHQLKRIWNTLLNSLAPSSKVFELLFVAN